jgi:hypothetical protein
MAFSSSVDEKRKREREELKEKAFEFRRLAIERVRLLTKGH